MIWLCLTLPSCYFSYSFVVPLFLSSFNQVFIIVPFFMFFFSAITVFIFSGWSCSYMNYQLITVLFIYFIQHVLISYLFYTKVYICQPQSSNSPQHHPPRLRFPPLVSIHLFSTSVSLFLPCKPVHLYHFSRFQKYALICFSLSDLLHSVWQSLSPTTSLQMTQFRSFLWLSNIPLYICTTPSLSISLSMGI